jgi:hypothetical protein
MAPKVVRDIPGAVQKPARRYGAIVLQAEIGQRGDESAEGELPDTEASAQIGGPSSSEEDGAEPLPGGFAKQGAKRDEQAGDAQRRDPLKDRKGFD